MDSLYDLTQAQLALKNKLIELDFDSETIQDTLDGNSQEIDDKIESYGFFIRDRQSFADSMKAEIDRMTARHKAELKRIERTTEWLLTSMIALDKKSVECKIFTISTRDNPKKVSIIDESLIPNIYMRKPETPADVPDKKAILDILKSGESVPGCKMVSDKRLVIK